MIGAHEFDHPGRQCGEMLPRLQIGRNTPDQVGDDLWELRLHDLHEEILGAGEILVEGGAPDPGSRRDVGVGGTGEAVGAELLQGGFEQFGARLVASRSWHRSESRKRPGQAPPTGCRTPPGSGFSGRTGRQRHMRWRIAAALTAVALIAAACGGRRRDEHHRRNDGHDRGDHCRNHRRTDDHDRGPRRPLRPTPQPPRRSSSPASTESHPPSRDTSRIVSLNGDLTEIVYELGLGDRVVAVDVTTTYPPESEALPRVGFGQQLAAEGVLGVRAHGRDRRPADRPRRVDPAAPRRRRARRDPRDPDDPARGDRQDRTGRRGAGRAGGRCRPGGTGSSRRSTTLGPSPPGSPTRPERPSSTPAARSRSSSSVRAWSPRPSSREPTPSTRSPRAACAPRSR